MDRRRRGQSPAMEIVLETHDFMFFDYLLKRSSSEVIYTEFDSTPGFAKRLGFYSRRVGRRGLQCNLCSLSIVSRNLHFFLVISTYIC
jgi:hypothetical protein